MTDTAFIKQLDGYGLTTAQIHYRMPDQPSLLQLYIWQDYDLAPEFPTLQAFLDFLAARDRRAAAFRVHRPSKTDPAEANSAPWTA